VSERASGVVKFFDLKKGWGFIEVDGMADVFVHGHDLGGLVLDEGDKVTFDLVEGKPGKGPKAGNVALAR
jgi:cold shock protein